LEERSGCPIGCSCYWPHLEYQVDQPMTPSSRRDYIASMWQSHWRHVLHNCNGDCRRRTMLAAMHLSVSRNSTVTVGRKSRILQPRLPCSANDCVRIASFCWIGASTAGRQSRHCALCRQQACRRTRSIIRRSRSKRDSTKHGALHKYAKHAQARITWMNNTRFGCAKL